MMTVEEQLWRAALRLERVRVEKKIREASMQRKKTSLQFLPDSVAKPWSFTNNYQYSISQLSNKLIYEVKCFDLKFEEQGFSQFLRHRGLHHLTGKRGSHRWNCLLDHGYTYKDFENDQYFYFAIEKNGKAYKYSDKERSIHQRIFWLSKIHLQAAWDHYNGRSAAKCADEIKLD